jgi:energy-coupling factor transporter ATP-binding protein EcfA2
MLTRLYIDNFRCFVNFEYRPSRRQLIFGGNGSGKSSIVDVLLMLRQFIAKGDALDDNYILAQRTRWMDRPQQTWELEANLNGGRYVYRLVIEPWGEPPRPRAAAETVHFEGKPVFESSVGQVHTYNDRFELKNSYDFDPHRSALATIGPQRDNLILSRFKMWLGGLFCFRINPYAMPARAEGEDLFPNVNLSNFAAWYRHFPTADPAQNEAMLGSLRAALDGFRFLRFDPFGKDVSLLAAEFGKATKYYFNELSDGQRCLICLYAILHFLLAKGATVILDEPDNFVSLREIQPWLMAATDAVEEAEGQLLVISHHPEILNQWAPGGVQFVRDGGGPVRVVEFRGDPAHPLTPSELVARGWERELNLSGCRLG